MIEKGKISSLQMGILLYPTILATALLSIPSATARLAKNDLWLSPIWASLIGFIIVYIAIKLYKFYPKQTLIQYSESILGKIVGKALGFFLIINLLIANGFATRQYSELVTGTFLSYTPMIVVTASLVLICAFAVKGGLEVVGRSAEIFIPLYVFSLVMIIVFLVPEFQPKNLLPVFEKGILPSIKGSAIPQTMFTLYYLIAFLLPYLSDDENALKWSMISVSAVLMTLVITNLTILFVFGETASNYVYPFLNVAKYISIADFFENVESVIMAVWVAGSFIKLSLQYYITVLAASQLLGLSESSPIVFPIGILIVLFSSWGIPNLSQFTTALGTTIPFYSAMVNVVPLLLLLVIAAIRNKGEDSNKGSAKNP